MAWAEGDRDRHGGDGAKLGGDREEHAQVGPRHDEADIEQHADAHEHEAGDQAVAEHEGVDRLQEIDLQDVHQLVGLFDERRQHEGAVHLAGGRGGLKLALGGDIGERGGALGDGGAGLRVEEEHAGIDGAHAQSHRDHEQWLQDAFFAHVEQDHAQDHHADAAEEDGRVVREGLDQGLDALEEVENV